MGLFGRKSAMTLLISKNNKKNWVSFAREHPSWSNEKCGLVLFSDENKFNRMIARGL